MEGVAFASPDWVPLQVAAATGRSTSIQAVEPFAGRVACGSEAGEARAVLLAALWVGPRAEAGRVGARNCRWGATVKADAAAAQQGRAFGWAWQCKCGGRRGELGLEHQHQQARRPHGALFSDWVEKTTDPI